MTPRPLVAVFAKAPEPGRVKTRLTPVLRAREAAELYEALLLDTLEIVRGVARETVVAFTPATGRRAFERLLPPGVRLVPQGPGDLGARLAHVSGRLLESRRVPLLVIGSDCPAVTESLLLDAARGLDAADVVLVPTFDGGYALIGTTRPRPEVFQGIPWSTDRVLETTLERAQAASLSVRLLDPVRDLDTPADLFEWYVGARAAEFPDRCPRTSRILHAILPPRRLSELEAVVEAEGR